MDCTIDITVGNIDIDDEDKVSTPENHITLNEAIHLEFSSLFRQMLTERYGLAIHPSMDTHVISFMDEIIRQTALIEDEQEQEKTIKALSTSYFLPFFEGAKKHNLRLKVRKFMEEIFIEMLKEYYEITIPGRYDPQVIAFGKATTKKALAIKDKEEQKLFITTTCREFLEHIFSN